MNLLLVPQVKRGKFVVEAPAPDSRFRYVIAEPSLIHCPNPFSVAELELIEGPKDLYDGRFRLVVGEMWMLEGFLSLLVNGRWPTRITVPARQNFRIEIEQPPGPVKLRCHYEVT